MQKTQSRICSIVIFLAVVAPLHRCRAQDDFDKWKEQEQQKLQQWKDDRDKSFTEFLKKEWKEYEALDAPKKFTEPKPVKIPPAAPEPASSAPRPDESRVTVRAAAVPVPPETIKAAPLPAPKSNETRADINFFGALIPVSYDRAMASVPEGPPDEKNISGFWQALGTSDYMPLLALVQSQRTRMNLNDWGYCVLLNSIAQRVYTKSNDRLLFVWFMLAKSGYRAKIGYEGNTISLLLPMKYRLYGVPYFMLGKAPARYYTVTFDPAEHIQIESLRTYEDDYPDATRAIDCSIDSPPVISDISGEKKFTFAYGDTSYTIAIRLNGSDIRFFERCPQTESALYFKASPCRETAASLLAGFKPIVEGRSETEAVNLLLRFVQTAFGYKTDQEQFGREKPMYPDETLFYAYSDCEDRAVLFAYLVRTLLNLEVVGVKYPNHIATAVKFTSDVGGDAIVIGEKHYIICDPTYENADYGMSMPEFESVKPEVIKID